MHMSAPKAAHTHSKRLLVRKSTSSNLVVITDMLFGAFWLFFCMLLLLGRQPLLRAPTARTSGASWSVSVSVSARDSVARSARIARRRASSSPAVRRASLQALHYPVSRTHEHERRLIRMTSFDNNHRAVRVIRLRRQSRAQATGAQ
jgi:hypothetical protein